MSRTARASRGGVCYHVLNRGNARATVFHDPQDYSTFVGLMQGSRERVRVELFAYCLMPNHFHLVARPLDDGDLGVWMQRLLTAHVKRHSARYGSVGRIWQGRFKAFPIQSDRHLLTVIRYVERNPLRARLVGAAASWPWSSLQQRLASPRHPLLDEPPVPLGEVWVRTVEEPLTLGELAAIRECVRRERPLGDAFWVRHTAQRLGLASSLRPRGRPRVRSRGTRR